MIIGHTDPLGAALVASFPLEGSVLRGELVRHAPFYATTAGRVLEELVEDGLVRLASDAGYRNPRYALTENGACLRREIDELGLRPSGICDHGLIDLYSQGSCHVFALAAADNFRGQGYRVFFDPFELACTGEQDGDDDIMGVIHVYAIVERDGAEVALDIFGTRPLAQAEAETIARFSPGIVNFEDCDAADLARLIDQGTGCGLDPFKPLHRVGEDMVERARRVAGRIYPDLAPRAVPEPEF